MKRTLDQLPPVVPGAVYHMHGDPGLKKDAFSLAMCHTTDETKTVTEGETKTPIEIRKTVVDFLITWESKSRQPVDLLNVDAILKELVQHYNVRRVTFDRWNSTHSIQDLIKMGVEAETYTLVRMSWPYRTGVDRGSPPRSRYLEFPIRLLSDSQLCGTGGAAAAVVQPLSWRRWRSLTSVPQPATARSFGSGTRF